MFKSSKTFKVFVFTLFIMSNNAFAEDQYSTETKVDLNSIKPHVIKKHKKSSGSKTAITKSIKSQTIIQII